MTALEKALRLVLSAAAEALIQDRPHKGRERAIRHLRTILSVAGRAVQEIDERRLRSQIRRAQPAGDLISNQIPQAENPPQTTAAGDLAGRQ